MINTSDKIKWVPDGTSALAVVKRLIVIARIPYRGLTFEITSQLGGALGLVLVALAGLAAVFENPTQHGDLGWVILGVNVAIWLVGSLVLVSGGWVQSANALLFTSYLAAFQVALLVWAGQGAGSLYLQLYLIPLICVAAVHPLQRWVIYFIYITLLSLAPLVYDQSSLAVGGGIAINLILWLGLGFVVLFLMSDLRVQRHQLELDQSEASRLARLDSLTGLGNQRGFWESLHSEIAHARRSLRPLSIVLADLDYFKQINDRFGHREGDELLARVGVALARTARTSDKCFRYGGEEFVVILREVDMNGAQVAAERFRAAVSGLNSPAGPMTMSCGVSELDESMDGDMILRAADAALLTAKRDGRDRVVCAIPKPDSDLSTA